MRAYICEPTEVEKIAQFRGILSELGAVKKGSNWAIGVDMWTFSIKAEELCIFQDEWSLDIEGPDGLVSDIVSRMKS